MAGEGPPKGPVPRRPPPKRPNLTAQPTSPTPAQGPPSLPPPADAHIESVLTPRPAVAHRDTSLFQLKEAVRVVRDPRTAQPEPDGAQEPVARAGSGLGWEEPAGRLLPLPTLTELSGVVPAAAAVRAPVAVTGTAWDRPAHPVAVAGRLSSEEDEGEDEPFDEPAPVEREERVRSVRQLVLLAVSAVVFLAAGAMAIYAVRATDLVGEPEPGASAAAEPPGAPRAAVAPTGSTPTEAARSAEPVELERPERPADRPEERPPERPEERPPPDPQKPRPFEQLAARDADPAAAVPRAEPAAKVEVEKPPPKPSTKGGTLVLRGAANAGAIKLILICPSVPDRAEVVWPGGVTTVQGVSQGCTPRLQCMASSTSVQAKYLLSKTEATCNGCNKDRGDPVCQ